MSIRQGLTSWPGSRTFEGRVKVKAEDMGRPRLAGFCTLRVRIGDRNDNAPVFNLPHYTTSVEENCPVGRRVKQVAINNVDSTV